MRRHLARRSVGEDADQQRAVAGGVARAGRGDERGGLRLGQRTRRAGHEVEADGVRPGSHRRRQAGRLRDAADLDEGRAAVRGRIHAGRRHAPAATSVATRASTAAGVAAGAHEVLADERRVEADRPPAAHGGRVAQRPTRPPPGGRPAPAGAAASASSTSTRSVRRSRLLMPMRRASVPMRGAQLALVVCLHERLQAQVEGQAHEPGELPRADGARPAAAPRPRRRRAAAAADARRRRTPWPAPAARSQRGPPAGPSIEPPNQWGSTSTEIIDAPPAW